jgi:ribosomal protein S27E
MAASVAVKCPACDGIVEIDKPALGMHVDCPDCDELLLVTSLTPFTLSCVLDGDDVRWFEDERREA